MQVTSTAKSGHYRLVTDVRRPTRHATRSDRAVRASRAPATSRSTCASTRPSTATAAAGRTTAGADSATADHDGPGRRRPEHRDATPSTATTRCRRCLALQADRPFTSASAGYAGTASDGLTQLDADHSARHRRTTSAPDGNVVHDGAASTSARTPLTLALGFGAHARPRRMASPARPRTHRAFDETPQRSTCTLARYDARAARRPTTFPGLERAGGRAARPAYYLGQRRQGQRGQDVPGRDRRRPRVPVGAGGQRRRHARTARRRTSAPTARSSRATSTRRSPGCWRPATSRPRATPSRFLLRAPAAGRRPLAAQLPAQRQAGARHRRRPARRDRVPDPDGLPGGARRTTATSAPTTSARRPTSSSPTARRSAASAGRSRAATRRRRSPPRSPGSWRPARIADVHGDDDARARLPRHGRPLPALDQGLDGHDDRPVRARPLLHPALEDRRPERGDHLQPRQRQHRRRPARR